MHSCVRVKTGSRVAACKNYIGHSLVLRALQVLAYDTKASIRAGELTMKISTSCEGSGSISKS
jgi:hypothetical protein